MSNLCKKCGNPIGSEVRIANKRVGLCGRSYCLDCSPYGNNNSYQLSKRQEELEKGTKMCNTCNLEKPLGQFYPVKKLNTLTPYCKECSRKRVANKFRTIKQYAVTYLGGMCSACSLVDHPVVYDIHHIDPTEKEFNISTFGKFDKERLEKELDKCMLLCANCHRKEHAKY